MFQKVTVVLAAVGAVLGIQELAWGQLQSTTQQSMFGSRTLGGFPTAGNRTFSGSSLGSSSLSGSGLGSSSFGRTGSSGLGRSSSFGRSSTGTGMSGLQTGSTERFVRGNRQPGQFVGADTADVSGILGSLGAGTNTRSNQNFNARAISGQGRNRGNQPGAQPGGTGRGARGGRSGEQLAVAVELGFEPPAASAPEVLSDTLTTKIGQSKRIQTIQPIEVSLADGTAILRGVVATPHDRELAEQWMLLEPGVRAVRNELQVAGKASSEASGSGAAKSP
jgi:hypothetical protein